MLNKKEKNILFIFDVIEFVLSVIAVTILTIVFKLDNTNARYLFLGCVAAIMYSFYKTISIKNKKRVIKNQNVKIDSKYIKELSI